MQGALSIKCDLHTVLDFSWLYCVETSFLDGNSQVDTWMVCLASKDTFKLIAGQQEK